MTPPTLVTHMRRLPVLLAALALTGLVVGCATQAGGGGGGTSVATTLTDSSVTLATTSTPAGAITFDVNNQGTMTHELYVFRTDLPADQLPVANGEVPKTGDGVEFIAEVEDIAPGTSKPLAVQLDAGSYVLLCNLPGHYANGMHASFDVV